MPAGDTIQQTETVSTIVPGRLPGGMDALMEVLQGYRDEDAVRVVVLDFSSAVFDGDPGEAVRLEHFPIPLVCAWPAEPSAMAFAAGLFCDVRVGAEGLVEPGNLPPVIEARRSLVCGNRSAEQRATDPLAAGLVSAIRRGGEVLDEAQRLANVMAERGPLAIQLAKEAIWRGIAMPLEQALRFETDLTLLLQTTNDRAEGVAAFVEKRPPRFTGT